MRQPAAETRGQQADPLIDAVEEELMRIESMSADVYERKSRIRKELRGGEWLIAFCVYLCVILISLYVSL